MLSIFIAGSNFSVSTDYNIVKEIFEEDFTKNFFNQKLIIKMLDEHYTSKKNHCRKLWTIFVFLVWYKKFFIEINPEN